MADPNVQGAVPSAPPATGERRKGGRRAGDHGEERRTRESFGGVGHQGKSFFDHPWWVVGTVVFGVLVGMLIMLATSTPPATVVTRTNLPSGGIDVIVKPETQDP